MSDRRSLFKLKSLGVLCFESSKFPLDPLLLFWIRGIVNIITYGEWKKILDQNLEFTWSSTWTCLLQLLLLFSLVNGKQLITNKLNFWRIIDPQNPIKRVAWATIIVICNKMAQKKKTTYCHRFRWMAMAALYFFFRYVLSPEVLYRHYIWVRQPHQYSTEKLRWSNSHNWNALSERDAYSSKINFNLNKTQAQPQPQLIKTNGPFASFQLLLLTDHHYKNVQPFKRLLICMEEADYCKDS
jgi:hypothetical protein